MNFENLKAGYELTPRELAFFKQHILEAEAQKAVATQKRPANRGQITQAEVDFMVKAMEAPDVNLFVNIM